MAEGVDNGLAALLGLAPLPGLASMPDEAIEVDLTAALVWGDPVTLVTTFDFIAPWNSVTVAPVPAVTPPATWTNRGWI